MRGPEIISFNNGVIEWTTESGVEFCVLEIDGETVSDRYSESAYTVDITHDANITITAVKGKCRAETALKFDAKTQKLYFAPVKVSVAGERIKWSRTGGASSYRVYDLDYNCTTVFGTEYDLSDRNIALCVCPDSCVDAVNSALPEPSDIDYLAGAGTENEPYSIHTPFELRAVDYYEAVSFERGNRKAYYRIENDIDYGAVGALESESNLHTLKKPFFGTLDGNNKRLVNIRVCYKGGFWALFDFIASSGRVKNIIIDNAEIYNKPQDFVHPLNSSVAAIANVNDGEIAGIKLESVRLIAQGGGVSGIVTHNYGKVVGCTVYAELVQAVTEPAGGASYEMAGIALENLSGGVVGGNRIVSLNIRGMCNVRSAAGIVAVNRSGGTVSANELGSISISGAVAHTEYGGAVAYNGGTVERGGATLGSFTVNGERIESEIDCNGRGRLVGKNDGQAV